MQKYDESTRSLIMTVTSSSHEAEAPSELRYQTENTTKKISASHVSNHVNHYSCIIHGLSLRKPEEASAALSARLYPAPALWAPAWMKIHPWMIITNIKL